MSGTRTRRSHRRIWLRTQAGALTLGIVLSGTVGAASAHHLDQQPTGPYPAEGITPQDGYLLVPEQWTPTVKLVPRAADPTQAAQVSDKVKLRYQVRFGARGVAPEPGRRYPAVLVFQGYNHRVEDLGKVGEELLAAGYAVVAVSARGTGCSSGKFDIFSPTEARDAAAAIEWIAEREWSDGNVALFGASYSAIEAFAAAPERPQHLRAVSAISPITDLYRDVASPGGILNEGLAAGFEVLRALPNTTARLSPVDDEVCHQNQMARAQDTLAAPVMTWPQHPSDDEFMRARSSVHRAHLIDVPVQTFIAWQDNVLGSRAVEVLERLQTPYHAILANGDHQAFPGVVASEVVPFLDRYVKGVPNGYENTPRVRVMWEARKQAGELAASWTSSFGDWPTPVAKPEVWHLDATGGLTQAPVPERAASYAYVPGSGQSPGTPELDRAYDPWQRGAAPMASLTYTSPPLERDTSVLGSASLDLRLSSTAADTDVQAVLTEVRPDGQEVFVQRGWLRASHRELDPNLSTESRPYHVHRPVAPEGVPLDEVQMRVEIRPFGHVFRSGSRIRVYVEAPSVVPDYFSFASLPDLAQNTIHSGGSHPSRLVLPVLSGHPAKAPLPPCSGPETPLRYRCRPAR
jgi:putative CocE/NonD family hydrolase